MVQVWDAAASKQISAYHSHTARVGALAWNGDFLTSGSRDRGINQRDIREPPAILERQLVGHRQEVISSFLFIDLLTIIKLDWTICTFCTNTTCMNCVLDLWLEMVA